MTCQNHGYAVNVPDADESEWEPLFTNANDRTNEGLIHKRLPYFRYFIRTYVRLYM